MSGPIDYPAAGPIGEAFNEHVRDLSLALGMSLPREMVVLTHQSFIGGAAAVLEIAAGALEEGSALHETLAALVDECGQMNDEMIAAATAYAAKDRDE